MRGLASLAAVALASCTGATTSLSIPIASGRSDSAAPAFLEEHRPAWHYTPPRGWMNDPNGMVYHHGEYHLFYQYFPDDIVWGAMHWGHAVSADLIHWETLPIALTPEKDAYVFSGSAVIDRDNTAGFGKDALIAVYTIHDPLRGQTGEVGDESQGIAFSQDRGRTFKKFGGNPVLANPGQVPDFRDPSVFRDEARNRWVMALAVTDHVRFFASDNLKDWVYLSSFHSGLSGQDGVWECPNLFPIRDERSGKTKWVLLLSVNSGGPQGGSGTQYFVGDWDGSTFTLDPEFAARLEHSGAVWFDAGADNYAGLTWTGAPDDRRIFIGWMSNWTYADKTPSDKWRGAMTAPRDLTLYGIKMLQTPVKELQAIRGPLANIRVADQHAILPKRLLPSADLDLEFKVPDSGGFSINLSNELGEKLIVGLDTQGWFIDRSNSGKTGFHSAFEAVHRSPRKHNTKNARIRIMIDRTSVELFADDGETVMTDIFFPSQDFSVGKIAWSSGGHLRNHRAWPLTRD